ncbi:MAG: hypothetical protein QMD36_01270 [Candidatus Aenigmarchaeota archaeon]|nr:hypothetical protein [Candidatus Aenigmarchaeota archaeon]
MPYLSTLSKLILLLLAVAIASYLFYKGLVFIEPPSPESKEKARFLRTLTCAYAMCARKGCDAVIIDIGFLDKDQTISCYKKCKEFENRYHEEHKCGSNYKLEFTFEDNVVYHADYITMHDFIIEKFTGIETDITRYEQWFYTINSDCDDDKNFCDYSHGVLGEFVSGKCEGVLEKSDKPCERIKPGTSDWTCKAGTGHIWVGPDLGNQCNELAGYKGLFGGWFGNPLYANCTFNEGQTIYVWAESDIWDNWPMGTYYCPELILCGS